MREEMGNVERKVVGKLILTAVIFYGQIKQVCLSVFFLGGGTGVPPRQI